MSTSVLPTSRTIETLKYLQDLNEQLFDENIAEGEFIGVKGEDIVKKTYFERLKNYFTSKDLIVTITYCCVLGLAGGFVSVLYMAIEKGLVKLHDILGHDEGRPIWMNEEQGNMRYLHYLLYVLHTVFWATLAASCPAYITKFGAGSGIPELKAVISGISLGRYLSMKTAVTKFLGLVMGAGAGLFTGREGPFVCLGGCLAHILCKLPGFREKFLRNSSVHRSMLAVGAAVGITSTFGTAVGGVIFSLEVTASFYMVSEVWKCFLGCTVVAIVFQFVRFSGRVASIEDTHFDPVPWGSSLFLTLGIGILGGMAGALFNTFVKKFGYVIKKNKTLASHPVVVVAVWALVTGICSFPFGSFLRNEWDETMNDMFTEKSLRARRPVWYAMFGDDDWSIIPALFCMFFARLILTCVTISCPLPTGIFVPSLCMGSILGRLYGEFLYLSGISRSIPPGIYALVGSAAMCTAVTHSIAVGVILLELTGQFYHILHLLLGVLVALAVSSTFCPSYYENALVSHNIPYLPYMMDATSTETARDMMNTDVQFISMSAPLKKLKVIVRKNPEFIAFPLVDSEEAMTLIGAVKRSDLIHILETVGLLPRADQPFRFSRTWDRISGMATMATRRGSEVIVQPSPTPSTHGLMKPTSSSTRLRASPDSGRATPLIPENGSSMNLATVPPEMNAGIVYRDDDDDVGTNPAKLDPEVTTLYKWPAFRYDAAPLQIPELTSRSRVHFFFTMLACSYIYVTNRGRLVGVLTKRSIIEAAMR